MMSFILKSLEYCKTNVYHQITQNSKQQTDAPTEFQPSQSLKLGETCTTQNKQSVNFMSNERQKVLRFKDGPAVQKLDVPLLCTPIWLINLEGA